MMENIIASSKCPQCSHAPAVWRERPAHGSRELYWVGCQKDGHLAGGISHSIALQNWNRMVIRWKYEHRYNKAAR